MKAFAVYTSGRVLVFAVLAGLLYLVGLRSYLLVAVAILLSLPVAYVVLARQREAFTTEVERRVESRRTRRTNLRAQLRGDDSGT